MSRARSKKIRPKAEGAFHHGDLREALVLAATRAVAERGHAEVSLRPLAEQLGVSQPALYRHFPSKEALLSEVALRGWAALQAAMGVGAARARDPFDAVRATGRAYVRWAQANPQLFRLMSSRVPADQRDGPLPALPREHYHAGLAGAVHMDEPLLPDAFRATWAIAHGLATFVVEHVFALVDTDEARLAAADGAIDCYVEMLRARFPPEPSDQR